MPDNQLWIILEYAYQMSTRVAPIDLPGHDGMICDFFDDLAMSIKNGETLDLVNDEFYKEAFNRMTNRVELGR
jgi:hypothetical protein